MKLHNPAPAWKSPRSDRIVLWHGCTDQDEGGIIAYGIDLTRSRWSLDFGRGFYTTTLERQARQWAKLRYDEKFRAGVKTTPVVLRFEVKRFDLANLKCLNFVRGHFESRDFWSLVQRCRRSIEPNSMAGNPGRIRDHRGPVSEVTGNWYDVVCGPVAAFWQQRVEMGDADQYSFHTAAALSMLNKVITAAAPGFVSKPIRVKAGP